MESQRERLVRKLLADPPSVLRHAGEKELERKIREMVAYLTESQVTERLLNYPIPARLPIAVEPVMPEDEARWRIAARRPKRSYEGATSPLTAKQRAELDADVREVLGEDQGL